MSSSSPCSQPAPKAKARASSRGGTRREIPNPEEAPRRARSRSRATSEEPMGQLAPSKIGIQKVREELENAKNKGRLSDIEKAEYEKLHKDWVAAKRRYAIKTRKA
jgi:hypothetical protein